jgi:hypothetical protein
MVSMVRKLQAAKATMIARTMSAIKKSVYKRQGSTKSIARVAEFTKSIRLQHYPAGALEVRFDVARDLAW